MPMKKAKKIALNALPILMMMGLIPIVADDYMLTFLYVLIISFSLWVRRTKYDITAFVVGFFLMTLAEYLFVKTGVEIFLRNTLFGVMPLWLPFLWGYGYVAMKHIVQVLSRKEG
jgi:hypothetical protein